MKREIEKAKKYPDPSDLLNKAQNGLALNLDTIEVLANELKVAMLKEELWLERSSKSIEDLVVVAKKEDVAETEKDKAFTESIKALDGLWRSTKRRVKATAALLKWIH